MQSAIPSRSDANRLVLIGAVVLTLCAVAFLVVRDRLLTKGTPATQATRPTTRPGATRPADQPKPPTDYLSLVRHHYPDYPATQPLGRPLALRDAGQFLIPDPVHLDPWRGV